MLLGYQGSTLLQPPLQLVSLPIGRLPAVDEVEDIIPTAHVFQRLHLILDAVHPVHAVTRHRLLEEERGPLRLQSVMAWLVFSGGVCRHHAGSMFLPDCRACPNTSPSLIRVWRKLLDVLPSDAQPSDGSLGKRMSWDPIRPLTRVDRDRPHSLRCLTAVSGLSKWLAAGEALALCRQLGSFLTSITPLMILGLLAVWSPTTAITPVIKVCIILSLCHDFLLYYIFFFFFNLY